MAELTEEKSRIIRIPNISGERLSELLKRIKPVVYFAGRGLCYIKELHPFVIYLRYATPLRDADDIRGFSDIITYHTYGYRSIFNPTIAEVLAQIPEQHVDNVIAFEILSDPNETNDFNKDSEALAAGYHAATTRLYVRK